MGCAIFGIFVSILGALLTYIGITDGEVFTTILGIIFILPGIFMILALIFGNTEKAKQEIADSKKRFEEKVQKKYEEENVVISQEFRTNNYSYLAIDETNKKVCFLESNLDINTDPLFVLTDNIEYSASTFSYRDILEAEVIIDGETVTKTSRSSQLGGAVLGGILAGGAGAIIGGLSGKTSAKEKVKSLQLKVIVNSTKNPFKIVYFLNEPAPIDRSKEKFKLANDEAMHWHSLFKVIIDMADKEDKRAEQQQQKQNSQSQTNSADEIRKLYDLFKEGILTEEEFTAQKKKLLEK